VALDENLVGSGGVVVTFEKVVETDFVERSARSKRGDVPADGNTGSLGSVHHDGRVPAHPSTVGTFYLLVAGEIRLVFWRNGVYVISSRY
jgi:hypothetical protein